MLQRVPRAESGYMERYSEKSEFWKQNRITPRSCIPTALGLSAETMMGAPITAQEYRGLYLYYRQFVAQDIRTYQGLGCETQAN